MKFASWPCSLLLDLSRTAKIDSISLFFSRLQYQLDIKPVFPNIFVLVLSTFLAEVILFLLFCLIIFAHHLIEKESSSHGAATNLCACPRAKLSGRQAYCTCEIDLSSLRRRAFATYTYAWVLFHVTAIIRRRWKGGWNKVQPGKVEARNFYLLASYFRCCCRFHLQIIALNVSENIN